jgi:peptidoglycan hydrolase-like protein with peptidoglycan-binding domain
MMLSLRVGLALLIAAGVVSSSAFASRAHRSPTNRQATHSPTSGQAERSPASGRTGRRTHRLSLAARSKAHRARGQQSIQPERVTQIQQALIREHYLTGEATGNWDATTVAAMQKYQSDQGWQTKLMPDSRALKKLGLGPDYSGALNAKNSSFSDPPPASTIPLSQDAGFSVASGVNQ